MITKGKIYYKSGFYEKALESFQLALLEGYKCKLAKPGHLKATPFPEFEDQGRIWGYIYQTYYVIGDVNKASNAYKMAVNLYRESRGTPADIAIQNEKDFKAFIERLFITYNLNNKPLRPFR